MKREVNENRVADFALHLIEEQSISGDEGRVAALVKDEMEKHGFDVEVDALGNVVGVLGSGGRPLLLVDSHMDTVSVTDTDAWSYNPNGQRLTNRIYGRGAVDMKGPLAASIHGIATLKDRLCFGTVVVSATVAEELIEGTALAWVIEKLRPDFALICEPTSGNIARAQKGRAEVKIEVFGRQAHSSRPELGVNAVEAMMNVVLELRRLRPPYDSELGEGLLVLTDIASSPYPSGSVVPSYCVATLDRRTLPGETEEDFLHPIREAAIRSLNGCEAWARVSIAEDDFESYTGERIHERNFAPAWRVDAQEEIVRLSLAGLREAGIDPELTHYSFCTNGSASAGWYGVPTIGFGPGDGSMAHCSDEYVEIHELAMAARGYASIAWRLVEGCANPAKDDEPKNCARTARGERRGAG